MKKNFYLLLLLLIPFSYSAFAQSGAPGISWQKTIGGSSSDVLTATAIAPDKSIILCGYSNSATSGNKSKASFGGYDYWIVKLNANGGIIWNKTYGGSKNDYAAAVICTADGGYLVGGSSISDKSGSKTTDSYGKSYDYWVLKLDANGNKVWDKTLGGLFNDYLTSLTEMPAGGYAVGGYAYSGNTGSKKKDNLGTESNADYWVVVLNNNGSEKMQNVFGGGSHDVLSCVAASGASSYYAAGYSYSTKRAGGYKSQNGYGNNDYYLLRYNTNTKKTEYQKDFGGKLSDYLTSIQVMPDNSAIIGGYSNSYKSNYKKDGFYGVTDFWLIKLNTAGDIQWDKTIAGGAGDSFGGDYLVSVQQTTDKGFILGGYSNSNIGHNKTVNSKGGYDYWIVKVDSLGNVQWDKTIGGNADDILIGVYEVGAGQYVVAGTSGSGASGDKSSGVVGGTTTDYWVLHLGNSQLTNSKLSTENLSKNSNTTITGSSLYKLEIMPNPVKDILNIRYNAAANSKVDFVIYDANGKAVLQSTLSVTTAESMRTFNIANLPNGSYFAVMYAGEIKITKAFTKE